MQKTAYPVRLKKENRFSHPLIADGDLHQFRRIFGAKFEDEVLAVGLDGLDTEKHPVGNLLIGAAVHDVAQLPVIHIHCPLPSDAARIDA